eukprot:CAMPEP_0177665958 /NCGR_PEP_ID=MMETSP0447-20121125/21330_1 /TAXON_ID=0 /ORGANISM="Stygamoeba regulata, Strain BSH-02190019" /LENGTH=428 /DNA_ID=CAMNT_0019172083 /DNA_START=43 /DNA_END=1329 /DNA_ORIENTATION=-
MSNSAQSCGTASSETHLALARAMVLHLRSVRAQPPASLPDLDSESLEVAEQCISAAFGLDIDEELTTTTTTTAPGASTLLSLFASATSTAYAPSPSSSCTSSSSSSWTTTTPAPAPATGITPEVYEKNWQRFAQAVQSNCDHSGGQPDAAFWQKARSQFESRFAPPVGHSPSDYCIPSSSTGDAQSSGAARSTAEPGAEEIAQADLEKDLGNSAIREKQYEKAVMHYSSALALRPNFAIYLANRAVARMYLEDYAAAEQDCKDAIAADPAYAKAYAHLGNIQSRQKNFESALKSYQKAAELDPATQAYKVKVQYAQSELDKSRAAADVSPLAGLGAGIPPAGGMPGMPAGGGMPNLAALAQNPAIMNMMQNMFGSQMDMSQLSSMLNDPSTIAAAQNAMAQNPELISQVMSSLGGSADGAAAGTPPPF